MIGMWKLCMRHFTKRRIFYGQMATGKKGCRKTQIRWEGKFKVKRCVLGSDIALCLLYASHFIKNQMFQMKTLAFGEIWKCDGYSTEVVKIKVHRKQTLPKAQSTQGLSSDYQSKLFRSYHKFSNKSWSDFIFKILTKHSFRISTKNNLHNSNQGSAAKYWLNFSFKIFCQNLARKVWTKICFYD